MSLSSPPAPLPVFSPPVAGGIAGAAPPSADLTNWFLDAKRSLSSVALCSRANFLVDSAREALQEAVIISSKCVFLRNALQDQLLVVLKVNTMMHSIREASRAGFEKILADLDSADAKLNHNLKLLRNSLVDPGFNTARNPDGDGSERGLRTLHDFVDDAGIEDLKSRLRHSIDQVQESHDALFTYLTQFDADLATLNSTVNSLTDLSSGGAQNRHVMGDSLQPHIHALEEQAEAMAQLLESLTQHYDRCCEALKQSEPTTNHNQEGGMMVMAESMSPEEKQLMYGVLERDAREVDSVVAELRERLGDMEAIQSHVARRIDDLVMLRQDTHTTFALFERFQANLAMYIDRMREFETQQESCARGMEERLDELWRLAEFYEGFMGAYDAMIVEVGRRQGVSARMESILRDTMKKLQMLHDDDLAERETFKDEQGDHLPVDIWPGVLDPPVRYSIIRDMGSAGELPVISRGVIEEALKRQQQLGKGPM